MSKPPFKVAAFGEILFDEFPAFRRIGGAPANVACLCRQFGCEVALISAVGRDADGDELLGFLRERGVNDAFVGRNNYPTGRVEVKLDAAGKAAYTIVENAAWDHIVCTDLLKATLPAFDVFVYGTLAQRSYSRTALFDCIRGLKKECIRFCDLNFRPPWDDPVLTRQSVELATVLKLNDEELPLLGNAFGVGPEFAVAQVFAETPVRMVIVSCGSAGAEIHHPAGVSRRPAAKVAKLVDTVGAGDSFAAAAIAGLLRGDDFDRLNDFANQVAAYVCGVPGATPELPRRLTGSKR